MSKINFPNLQYCIRVNLPNSGHYSCGPSGDTEYEEAYNNAIKSAMPDGFKLVPVRLGHKRPVDSEGFTWMLVEPSGDSDFTIDWRLKYRDLVNSIKKLF